MAKQALTRREFLKASAGALGLVALAGCAAPTPQVIRETVKETVVVSGTPQTVEKVVEKVVTVTPAPTAVPATAAPKQISLTFFNWASAEDVTRNNVNKIITKFQNDNPGVTIKNVPFGFGDIQNQIIIAITGGNPPDVMQVSSNMPYELAGMSALEQLDTYVTKEYLADNGKANLDSATYQGKLYAIPWMITPHAFWYSKKMMKKFGLDPTKPPQTIDELNAAFKTIKDQSKGDVYGMGLDTTKRQYALVHQWPWMLTFGAQPFIDGKPNFNTPEMVAYFTWLREITNQKYNPPGLILKDFRQFSAGDKEVFAWDGPYFKGTIQSLNKDLLDDKVFYDTWGVTSIPKGKLGKPITVTDNHELAISKACQNKAMAFKFIQALVSSDLAVTDYLIPLGGIPALQSSIDKFKDKFADPISQTYIKEIIPSSVPLPFGPKLAAASDFMLVGMQQAVGTNDPIDKILNDVQANLKVVYGL